MNSRDYSARTGGAPAEVSVDIWSADETTLIESVVLPTVNAVCWLCDGEGHHVDPSIDRNGLSADELYEDPDFADEYFNGGYDITCNECHGRRVVKMVDRAACAPEHLAAYDQEQEWDRERINEQMFEMRGG